MASTLRKSWSSYSTIKVATAALVLTAWAFQARPADLKISFNAPTNTTASYYGVWYATANQQNAFTNLLAVAPNASASIENTNSQAVITSLNGVNCTYTFNSTVPSNIGSSIGGTNTVEVDNLKEGADYFMFVLGLAQRGNEVVVLTREREIPHALAVG